MLFRRGYECGDLPPKRLREVGCRQSPSNTRRRQHAAGKERGFRKVQLGDRLPACAVIVRNVVSLGVREVVSLGVRKVVSLDVHQVASLERHQRAFAAGEKRDAV